MNINHCDCAYYLNVFFGYVYFKVFFTISILKCTNLTCFFQSTGSSSGSGSGGQVTKVTATAKFKMEVFTPNPEGSSRPASRSRSRRSSSGGADPLRASGDSSLASSLSSDPGFSEK